MRSLLNVVRLTLLLTVFGGLSTMAQDLNPLEGRWNLTINYENREMPSWLEIRHSGHKTLVGRFVFAGGSARPVAEVKYNGNKFSFAIPPQWEPGEGDMEFEGELVGSELQGSMKYTDGKTYSWTGKRSPELAYNKMPKWG